MIIEICANGFESAQIAQNAGANRIELCTNLSVGGLTPSYKEIEKVLSELIIPVHVLIRPRSGDFCYSESELAQMLRDIAYCKQLGCAGVVSGVLTSEGNIDTTATSLLVGASEGMEFTFHRAFDMCKDPKQSVKVIMNLGIDRLLSSGQALKAIDGINLLQEIKAISTGKIQIMPGSGINSENALFFKLAGFKSVHLSGIKKDPLSTSKKLFESKIEGVSDLNEIIKVRTICMG